MRRVFLFQEPDMAAYFTHFSCLLDVRTSENAARALKFYNTLSEGKCRRRSPFGRISSVDPARAWRHAALDS